MDVNVAADTDIAAPIDGAVAANANVAAPINAGVAANVGSIDSDAIAVAQQDAIIDQNIDGAAEANADQQIRHRPVTSDRPSRARRRSDVLRRADGVQLIGEMAGSGYRVPPSLVRRADGQTIQLTTLLYLTLEAIDDRRTADEVAEAVSATYGKSVSADNVRQLVDEQLRPLGSAHARRTARSPR